MSARDDSGALHLFGIVLLLVLGAAVFAVARWSHELNVMRSHVEEMQGKVELLELRVRNLEGQVVP